MNLPAATQGPIIPPPPGAKPSSGMSGCLKVLLIVAGIIAVCMVAVGIVVWQLVSFFGGMVEPQPMQFPPLQISAGEKEDVQRILESLNAAKQKGQEFDEYVTPQVFNGVLERILQGERDKGRQDVPLGVRAELAGDAMKLKLSAIADDKQMNAAGKQDATGPMYINGEASFNLEIVDGEARVIDVKSLTLGGRQAPSIVMWVIRAQAEEFTKHSKTQKGAADNPLKAIKLLKREGDRLHLILDGKQIPD